MRRRVLASLGGGWKNPYVTDGLVAMWDGEWNAGGGIHDPNATVWKDCVGDNDLVPVAGVVTFGETKVIVEGGYLSSSKPLAAKTVEVVFEWNAFPSGYSDFSCFISSRSSGGMILRLQTTTSFIRWTMFNGNLTYASQDYISIPRDLLAYSAMTHSGESYTTYGTRGKPSLTTTRTTKILPGVAFVGSALDTARHMDASWSAIRLYDRDLSADEIAANYAIDKARFGLT